MDLKLILLNARGIKNKKEELIERIKEADIAVTTETKNRRMENLKVTGYDTVLSNSRTNYKVEAGGIAIIVRKDIQCEQLVNLRSPSENIEIVGIKLKDTQQPINLIAIYRRPTNTEKQGVWRNIIEQIRTNSTDAIMLAGDFNAHHPAWNCHNVDKNGENLLDEMEEQEMVIINRNTKSRLGEGGQRSSNLDLMFCSENIEHLMDYQQGKDTWGSDHFPIVFTTRINRKIYKKITNRLSSRKTDWDIYGAEMERYEEKLEQEDYKNLNKYEKNNQIKNWMVKAVEKATYKNIQ